MTTDSDKRPSAGEEGHIEALLTAGTPGMLANRMTDRPHSLTAMTESWAKLTGGAMEAALTANTAALDAFTAAAGARTDAESDADQPQDDGSSHPLDHPEGREAGSVGSVLYEAEDWTVERSVSAAGLSVGDCVTFAKPVTDDDVRRFAAVSGDTNRLHLDEEFADETRFGGRIAHGGLVSALISAALARLPGVTIYLSQDLSFRGPVRIGDRASASVEVVEDVGGGRFRLETVVESNEEVVVDGEAVVLVEDAPQED